MAKAVKIDVPEGMYKEIEKLVKKRLFRSIADFFYIAGHEKLGKIKYIG
jgi:Arc/MetJ-type ribon-helix-helix transcriptional regulator